MGPGARHHSALEAALPPRLLWQERQQWLGQEETLLGHHLAPRQLSAGASTGSTRGKKSPTRNLEPQPRIIDSALGRSANHSKSHPEGTGEPGPGAANLRPLESCPELPGGHQHTAMPVSRPVPSAQRGAHREGDLAQLRHPLLTLLLLRREEEAAVAGLQAESGGAGSGAALAHRGHAGAVAEPHHGAGEPPGARSLGRRRLLAVEHLEPGHAVLAGGVERGPAALPALRGAGSHRAGTAPRPARPLNRERPRGSTRPGSAPARGHGGREGRREGRGRKGCPDLPWCRTCGCAAPAAAPPWPAAPSPRASARAAGRGRDRDGEGTGRGPGPGGDGDARVRGGACPGVNTRACMRVSARA